MKIYPRSLFILSAVLVSMLFLAACGATPAPENKNLLKMYDPQVVNINGLWTSVFPIDSLEASHPETATVDAGKMTIYVVTLAQKGEDKTLFVAPISTYEGIDLSAYQIIDTHYVKVAAEEVGTMLFLTNTTAADEGALPIFYP